MKRLFFIMMLLLSSFLGVSQNLVGYSKFTVRQELNKLGHVCYESTTEDFDVISYLIDGGSGLYYFKKNSNLCTRCVIFIEAAKSYDSLEFLMDSLYPRYKDVWYDNLLNPSWGATLEYSQGFDGFYRGYHTVFIYIE